MDGLPEAAQYRLQQHMEIYRETDRDRDRQRQRQTETETHTEIIKLNVFRDAVDSLLVCGTRIKNIQYHFILVDIIIGRKTEILLCDDFAIILRLLVDITKYYTRTHTQTYTRSQARTRTHSHARTHTCIIKLYNHTANKDTPES